MAQTHTVETSEQDALSIQYGLKKCLCLNYFEGDNYKINDGVLVRHFPNKAILVKITHIDIIPNKETPLYVALSIELD